MPFLRQKKHVFLVLLILLSLGISFVSGQEAEVKFRTSAPVPRYVPSEITIEAVDKENNPLSDFSGVVKIEGLFIYSMKDKVESIETKSGELSFEEGVLTLEKAEIRGLDVTVTLVDETESTPVNTSSSFTPILTILPPLIAIILAIVTKEVLLSLFAGVWVGVYVLLGAGWNPFYSLVYVVDTTLIATLSNEDYVHIIVFSLMIGGMIGVVASSGGIHDMVERISKRARTPRGGMVSTWFLGIVIFFDDYANTLIVGNSMRSITDRLRISREKLSYIVDSTAAPVCSIALISTWIGYELGLISSVLESFGQDTKAFEYFLHSLPFHFYSIFTIIFVFIISYTGKDFGPMLEAEKRARKTGAVLSENARPLTSEEMEQIEPPEGKPCRWYNALIPIFTVIMVAIFGLFYDGYRQLDALAKDQSLFYVLRDSISSANSYDVLLWAAFWGGLSAAILAVSQNILSTGDTINAWIRGVKSMILAILVLVMAWTIKEICTELGTNRYIFYGTKDLLSAKMLPFLGFIISAVVAFATGTSWGTMGLMFPLVLPLAIDLSTAQLGLELTTSNYIVMGTLGSILAGASFGDHCSPISDTTVMSSMACGADHIDHVKTQMPYALLSAIIACVFGYIPIGLGVSPWLCLPAGIVAMIALVYYVFQEVPSAETT